MRIDIWSDVICPFCYIGKAELEKALEGRGDVEIVHHAFRLSPGAAVEPVDTMLAQKYGLSLQQVAQNQAQVTQRAASVGLDFHLEGTRAGDTKLAQRLLLAAQAKNIDLVDALYRAYFTDGKDIFDADVLADIADANGFARDEAQAVLTSAQWDAPLEADEHQARQMNVRGVPFFVIDNAVAVSGAQPAEAFNQAIDMAIAKNAPVEGDVCGPDGCAV